MNSTRETSIRVTDMAVCTPPKKLRDDLQLLATFDVLIWPIRANKVRLVRHQGEVKVWASSPDLRFLSAAKPLIIEEAMRTAREAFTSDGLID